MSRSFLFPTLAVLALVSACGSSGDGTTNGSFSGAPLTTVKSQSGQLTIAVRSSPQPPARGLDDFELVITDENGSPRDGLKISVTPWMTSHDHGTSITPTIEASGNGRYVVHQVSLYMPGHWELQTDLSGADRATIAVDVP